MLQDITWHGPDGDFFQHQCRSFFIYSLQVLRKLHAPGLTNDKCDTYKNKKARNFAGFLSERSLSISVAAMH
jgi:hypothetical protein